MQSSTPDEGSHIIFSTADPEVLEGVHEFLRFQISDLKTGDSLEMRERGELEPLEKRHH